MCVRKRERLERFERERDSRERERFERERERFKREREREGDRVNSIKKLAKNI